MFSADEGADVGADEGTPVTEIYKVPFKFTGKIARVRSSSTDVKSAAHEETDRAHPVARLKKTLTD